MKKIPTVFERIYENHKVVGITPTITPGCEEAFKKGIATVKWDGSCTAIIGGKFYRRFDAKKGRKIPGGAIPCQPEADPITGHFPHWVLVTENNPADKWYVDAYKNYAATHPATDGTYEAVGVNFQGNPYDMNLNTLIPHGKDELAVRRTFEAVKAFLAETEIEGIVFWLNGEPKCKIKRTDFGFEWPVNKVDVEELRAEIRK